MERGSCQAVHASFVQALHDAATHVDSCSCGGAREEPAVVCGRSIIRAVRPWGGLCGGARCFRRLRRVSWLANRLRCLLSESCRTSHAQAFVFSSIQNVARNGESEISYMGDGVLRKARVEANRTFFQNGLGVRRDSGFVHRTSCGSINCQAQPKRSRQNGHTGI